MTAQRRGPTAARGPEGRRPGFATRLLVAQALVLVAGAMSTWLVASAAGPGIFRDHLAQAGVKQTKAEVRHVEEAFGAAMLSSIGLALLAAVVAALLVSWYFSRRVQQSIGSVTTAAEQIASGRYGSRIPDPGLGGEFAALAASYNALAQRLEDTDRTRRRMLTDLAHEMRTPLATIDAHLEAVEDGIRPLDDDTLAVIRTSTRRLRRLAEDVGALSRAEEGSLDIAPVRVEAAALARAAVAAAQDRFAAKNVQLLLEEEGAEVPVLVDPDRIAQVLGNLLDNALRHTEPSGTVTVSCRRVDRWAELVVADTGEGIASEHLDHIFDRFYRVDTARTREHGGSGIGLSIARALVEAHGGGLRVSSAGSGSGARFTVRLPVAAPQRPAAS